MSRTTLFSNSSLTVIDYRCSAGPNEQPYAELHQSYSISYVRRGSFGYRVRGQEFDLIAGSLMVGHANDEYMCTHEHHACGDECLSFHFSENAAQSFGGKSGTTPWRIGFVPPISTLMVMGQLAQSVADGQSDLGFDEVAAFFTNRFCEVVDAKERRRVKVSPRDRRRAIEAALWLEAASDRPIDLDSLAMQFELSPFHFLRMFSTVTGVTPHQYLVRMRLKRAAQLLTDEERAITTIAGDVGFEDLSNFIRTFHRAAGASPREFRRAARGDRKILQDRMDARR